MASTNRLAAALKHRVVADTLMGADHFPQLPRNREGDQKVLDRQQLGRLLVQPRGGLVDPTSRAVAIAATTTDPMFSAAALTLINNATQLTGTTTRDRTEDLAVSQWDCIAKVLQVRRPVQTKPKLFLSYGRRSWQPDPARSTPRFA